MCIFRTTGIWRFSDRTSITCFYCFQSVPSHTHPLCHSKISAPLPPLFLSSCVLQERCGQSLSLIPLCLFVPLPSRQMEVTGVRLIHRTSEEREKDERGRMHVNVQLVQWWRKLAGEGKSEKDHACFTHDNERWAWLGCMATAQVNSVPLV